MAANRRRHGAASAPPVGTSNVTAYRGALTKSSAAGVNLGNLVSPSFNATSSTYTLTSGTSGHWTTPTDGTFPTPTAAGDTADLNGGPYVFAYTATDGTNSASGTLTVNIRANTYTVSSIVQLGVVKSSGFDGTTVELAKGSTDFATATDASPITFDWRATTGCTITHEDTASACTIGNIKISGGADKLTFSHITVTPNDRLTAAALQRAWYILSSATGSTAVTLNNCGVAGPADPTKTVYGMYIDARNAATTITTQDMAMTWVQYGFFPVYTSSFTYAANHNGQTTIRYFTADANRYGALSGNGGESIYYADLVVMSPMFDSTQSGIHPDGFQQNAGSVLSTGAVTADRYAFILADGNASAAQGIFTGSATGGPTVKNFIYLGRAQDALYFDTTDSTHMPRVGNATALMQWSGNYGPAITGINYHPDGNLDPRINLTPNTSASGVTLKTMFFYNSPANASAYSIPASCTHNGGSPDVSATLPNASWITSTTLKNAALLPANDVDNYTGVADSRWSDTTANVLASVISALTPASGQVGAAASDGSRPLATFP